jgi:cytochrome P450
MNPLHALDAASHPDPYPYYASLRAGAPLIHDQALNLWIASRASTVAEVFASPDCRVRPVTEPVPLALLGSPAGEVFGHLIRMNDGPAQVLGKGVLERALAGLPASVISAQSRHLASLALPALTDTDALNDWIFRTPVATVAALLGFTTRAARDLADLVRDFVACLSPSSTHGQRAQAGLAAHMLQTELRARLGADLASDSLLGHLRHQAQAAHWTDEAAILANLVGLLSQTYDATAGLLGNSIVALASHTGLLQAVRERAGGWQHLVQETSRHDPSVQNTRRFVYKPTRIAGVELDAGSNILLVLAAANRDPQVNHRPDEFLLDRPDRCVFSFSRGAHACPGQALATTLSGAALELLFDQHDEQDLRRLTWSYRLSANGRLPVFRNAEPI